MRELSPIRADVEEGFIVLAPDDAQFGEETYRLRITDELIDMLTAPSQPDVATSESREGEEYRLPDTDGELAEVLSDDMIVDVDEVEDDDAPQEEPEQSRPAPPRRLFSAGPLPDVDEPVTVDIEDSPEPVDTDNLIDDDSQPEAPAEPAFAAIDTPEPEPEPEPEVAPEPIVQAVPKPKYVLSPREIQDRIRSGATTEELVEETGMQYKRVDAFAHPVLADRARIAEQARSSHPQRADGPTKLTLWEVLATAFAARDLDLHEATWDSRRDATGQWIISVTWAEDGHLNVAEWSYHQESQTKASTLARNSAAADLMDPNPRAIRGGLSAVSSDATLPIPVIPEPVETEEYEEDEMEGVAFDPDDEGERPRKKTVMPSWEDVLLGVRVRPNDRK